MSKDKEDRQNYTLGNAPVEEKYHLSMGAIGQALDEFLNEGKHGEDRNVGFVLLVFPVGEEGRCNLISNGADRNDILALFKEMIARFEGQPELSGRA